MTLKSPYLESLGLIATWRAVPKSDTDARGTDVQSATERATR